MKRTLSIDTDEDSDDEQDFQKDGCPSQSYRISDRKKRRGVIEKRRRDRINNSLCELRRLVPAAFEKQGTAKIEKAEILQMTVDHLKLLQCKGLGAYDPSSSSSSSSSSSVALGYRITGFRECAEEVGRYLVSVEGLDLHDPLRLRLISHLQCCCTQREAVAKATMPTPSPPWNHVTGAVGLPRLPNLSNHYGHNSAPGPAMAPPGESMTINDQSGYINDHSRLPPHHVEGPASHGHRLPAAAPFSTSVSGPMVAGPPLSVHSQFFGVNSTPMLSPDGLQYHSSSSSFSSFSSSSSSFSSSSFSASSNLLGQNVKPYRPWGVELVY